jgi:hypothetical protein
MLSLNGGRKKALTKDLRCTVNVRVLVDCVDKVKEVRRQIVPAALRGPEYTVVMLVERDKPP